MVLIALGGALLSGPLLSSPDHEIHCVNRATEKATMMLPEMEGSLAASSRPSTSYAVQKPVPSQRHRLAPEQLSSTSSAVSLMLSIRKASLELRRAQRLWLQSQSHSISSY